MLKAKYIPYRLIFKEAGGTSRGVLHTKDTYFIKVWDDENKEIFGLGEAALFKGLSADDVPNYEQTLLQVCNKIHDINWTELNNWSSIRFGIECALLDLANGGKRTLFDTPFSRGEEGIEINGLIWMGAYDEMITRIQNKLTQGFHCLKLKIGAINFEQEIRMLQYIRERFDHRTLEIRVDANGAFKVAEAQSKLDMLSQFSIHSIEQPIAKGQWQQMAKLVKSSPIPIVLDEELIGINVLKDKEELLESICPHYIILKPALCGGLKGAEEWIKVAKKVGCGYWATSALESNISLNAIAQWCSSMPLSMPQGLGTGQLFTNNIDSPLTLQGSKLFYTQDQKWDLSPLQELEIS